MQINPVGVGYVPAPNAGATKRSDATEDSTSSAKSNRVAATEAADSRVSSDEGAVIAQNVRAAASVAHVLGRNVERATSGAIFDVRA
jgi:hypothetical protein